LSRKRKRECTRKEISDHLKGKLLDSQLEEKLHALESGDLITQGSSNFRYRGIEDDILDLIFRSLYEEEIYQTKPDIAAELTASVEGKRCLKASHSQTPPKLSTVSTEFRSLRGADFPKQKNGTSPRSYLLL